MNKTLVKRIIIAILFIGLPIAGGTISSLIANGVREKYEDLKQPPGSPPGFLFGIVWPILYALMGYGAFRIYDLRYTRKDGENVPPTKSVIIAFVLYGLQLALNYIWTPLFFSGYRLAALIEICFLWVAIVANIVAFWKLDKLAGALLLPYLAWVSFATYLTAATYALNR